MRTIPILWAIISVVAVWLPVAAHGEESVDSLLAEVERLYEAGKSADALPLAEKATALAAKVSGGDSPEAATAYRWAARVHVDMREKPTERRALFDKALAIRETEWRYDHIQTKKKTRVPRVAPKV